MSFTEISYAELPFNPMVKIPQDWMLITAGTQEGGYNTMLAAWGHLGAIWASNSGRPTSVIYIRPTRYTKEFVDREAFYTLSFYSPQYKDALTYLGTHSGRDEDKVAKVGFTPYFGENYTAFEEAEYIIICKKLYRGAICEEGFIDKSIIQQSYATEGFHDMYIGEIVKVLKKEK